MGQINSNKYEFNFFFLKNSNSKFYNMQRHWAMPDTVIPGKGGKPDDITVTVAQVFYKIKGEKHTKLAENDTYFTESKKLYSEPIPSNRFDMFERARFNT